ncbi:hypothetical protein E4U41_004350, partial [Claviceps citrina]
YPLHYRGLSTVLSVPLVLHLVESVLGYRPVYSDAKNWHYRRDTPLRSNTMS